MKNLGFGCMRLPMEHGGNHMNGNVDLEQFTRMVDTFLENGFTYFDTAHGYISGKSETAIRECLVNRYPREKYILANKLTTHFFNKKEEIRPLLESQLTACCADYFDYYLMHAQNAEFFKKYTDCHAYEIAHQLRAEGKIRHFGISFHDIAVQLNNSLKSVDRKI